MVARKSAIFRRKDFQNRLQFVDPNQTKNLLTFSFSFQVIPGYPRLPKVTPGYPTLSRSSQYISDFYLPTTSVPSMDGKISQYL
jgi:hypothetical protein